MVYGIKTKQITLTRIFYCFIPLIIGAILEFNMYQFWPIDQNLKKLPRSKTFLLYSLENI